ncbi:MAG: hypothetical protein ACYSUY_01875 [Planctomycetota bacterium]|jgi:hypothetical protein
MTNKALFCSFFALICTFCASLRPKRTVFTRPKTSIIYVNPVILSDIFRVLRGEKIREISVNPWLINDLRSTKAYVRKNNLFMQNKANFQKVKFNVNKVLTRAYEKRTLGERGKTNPIQSQFKANSKPIKAKTNPIQTQTNPIHPAKTENTPIRMCLHGPEICSRVVERLCNGQKVHI